MEQYSFSVTIKGVKYDVKSDFDDYEIWHQNKRLFVLMAGVDSLNQPKWILKGPSMADSVLVEKLGEEIEKNCCK